MVGHTIDGDDGNLIIPCWVISQCIATAMQKQVSRPAMGCCPEIRVLLAICMQQKHVPDKVAPNELHEDVLIHEGWSFLLH